MVFQRALLMASGLLENAYTSVPSHTEVLKLKIKGESLPYEPLNNHPDVFAFECSRGTVLSPNLNLEAMGADAPEFNNQLERLLESGQLVRGTSHLGMTYPETCFYNAIVFNQFIIGLETVLDPQVITIAKKSSLEFISVKQGYSRCSSFVIDSKTLVTSDVGIAKNMRQMIQKFKLDCQVVYCDPKEIELSGFAHGFIGGTTWQLEEGRRYFYGDVSALSNWQDIKTYLYKADVEPVYIRKKKLEDVGSAIGINYI